MRNLPFYFLALPLIIAIVFVGLTFTGCLSNNSPSTQPSALTNIQEQAAQVVIIGVQAADVSLPFLEASGAITPAEDATLQRLLSVADAAATTLNTDLQNNDPAAVADLAAAQTALQAFDQQQITTAKAVKARLAAKVNKP